METNADDLTEENASTAEETEDEPTEPLEKLEKPAPVRKPRTQKQKAAFEKAREALAVKRANDKEFKAANKKPIGRPKKVAAVKEKVEPKARRSVAQGGRKQTMVAHANPDLPPTIVRHSLLLTFYALVRPSRCCFVKVLCHYCCSCVLRHTACTMPACTTRAPPRSSA